MKKKETLPLIYIIGLPFILIIASSVAHVHFSFNGSPLYLYACIYPLTYLVSCLITRKSNLIIALNMMAIALVAQTMVFVFQWVLFDKIYAYLMIYTFLAFLIEHLILIFTYDFLIKIKKDTYFPIFLLILVVSVINNMFFGNLIEGNSISLSILPRLVYVVILPVFLARQTKK